MQATYPKKEKLKSRKVIDALFVQRQSVSKYPLRLMFMENSSETEQIIKMGVSVSKKHFKKAVDRNYYKRVLRECYRLNKHLLIENIQKPYAFMLLYQTADRLSYAEIFEKTQQLFEKFVTTINNQKQ